MGQMLASCRVVEVEEAERTESRRKCGVERSIFMSSYRAVIQSVCKSPSHQKSGIVVNQRDCGVKSAEEGRLLWLFENDYTLWLNISEQRWSSYTKIHTQICMYVHRFDSQAREVQQL